MIGLSGMTEKAKALLTGAEQTEVLLIDVKDEHGLRYETALLCNRQLIASFACPAGKKAGSTLNDFGDRLAKALQCSLRHGVIYLADFLPDYNSNPLFVMENRTAFFKQRQGDKEGLADWINERMELVSWYTDPVIIASYHDDCFLIDSHHGEPISCSKMDRGEAESKAKMMAGEQDRPIKRITLPPIVTEAETKWDLEDVVIDLVDAMNFCSQKETIFEMLKRLDEKVYIHGIGAQKIKEVFDQSNNKPVYKLYNMSGDSSIPIEFSTLCKARPACHSPDFAQRYQTQERNLSSWTVPGLGVDFYDQLP